MSTRRHFWKYKIVFIQLTLYFFLYSNILAQPVNCPQILVKVPVTTNATCNTANGTALIDILTMGGSPPYQLTLNGQTNTSGNFGSLGAGKYLLRVTDANGCKDSLTVTISSIGGIISPSFSTEAPATCNGIDGKIVISNTTGPGPFTYLLSNGTQKNSNGNVVFTGLPIGSYSMVITDVNGCEYKIDGITIKNEIKPGGVCNAGDDATIFEGESAYINGTADGVVFWEPTSFLSDTTKSNPTATPPAGIITYTIHSINEGNCTECTDKVTITVLREIDPPNTFTPNGDGANDVWVISGLSLYPDCEIWIYTRWGERILHQTGYESGSEWDGTNNGLSLPPATYYYVIDIKKKDTNGKEKKYAGAITIIK